MKKIISVFLILSLVSGCDKANILKPIQPVKNNTIIVEKTVELEVKEKIPSAVRFVLNHPYVSAVLAIAVMVAGGNLAYRWFKLKEKRSNLNVKDEPNVEPIQPVNEPEVDPGDIDKRCDEWLGWYCQQTGRNVDELLLLHHSTNSFEAMFLNGVSGNDIEIAVQPPVFYKTLFYSFGLYASSDTQSVPSDQIHIMGQAGARIDELRQKNEADVPDLKVQLLSTFRTYLSAAQIFQNCVSSHLIPYADKIAEAAHIYLDYVNHLVQFSQSGIALLEEQE